MAPEALQTMELQQHKQEENFVLFKLVKSQKCSVKYFNNCSAYKKKKY